VQLINYAKTKTLAELPSSREKLRYVGQAPDAPWRAAAAARIEKHRKGDLNVRVVDANGKPVTDAKVSIEMTRHAYPFGSAVTAQRMTATDSNAVRYREIVEANYNMVTLENDLKIMPWRAGKVDRHAHGYYLPNTMAALALAKERDIAVRGHTLLWGAMASFYYPTKKFDFANDPVGARKNLDAFAEDVLSATRGLISEWDVVNHPVADFGENGQRLDLVYGREMYAEYFHKAKAAQPDARRYINEGQDLPGDNEPQRQRYEELIQWLIDQKAPIDGIGFMGHFGAAQLNSPDTIYKLLERFGRFGLPMKITEFDVSSADGNDEQGQADYLRDVMTIFFSHPQTNGIILWGFWESAHWRPETALYRKDWTIKPAGQAWLNLVKRDWWTRETVRTGADGTATLRGFKGDYTVTVRQGDLEQTGSVAIGDAPAQLTLVIP
jgi:GH35 family endo-1,4-beta-xylanase